jgi:hypothetical protein
MTRTVTPVIASEAKQSMVKSRMLLLDRHGAEAPRDDEGANNSPVTL